MDGRFILFVLIAALAGYLIVKWMSEPNGEGIFSRLHSALSHAVSQTRQILGDAWNDTVHPADTARRAGRTVQHIGSDSWNDVTHPSDTAQRAGHTVANAVTHPQNTVHSVIHSVTNPASIF